MAMSYPVRCPVCRGVSRVNLPAVGAAVTCPACESPFRAVPEARVRTVGYGSLSGDLVATRPTSFLLGLALLPFGLPLFWVLGTFVINDEPVFSVLVAVAVAVCTE